jgi:hypothetical protein
VFPTLSTAAQMDKLFELFFSVLETTVLSPITSTTVKSCFYLALINLLHSGKVASLAETSCLLLTGLALIKVQPFVL